MKKIAVLMTCHNRRVVTMECLRLLFAQKLPDDVIEFCVYLVDDGSSDGTKDAIQDKYPRIRLLQGDGRLYWNQGMRMAWKEASIYHWDAYLWLNDDTMLLPGSLVILWRTLFGKNDLEIKPGIAIGNCGSPEIVSNSSEKNILNRDSNIVTYGGYVKNKRLGISVKHQLAEYFNGNLVLVSHEAFERLGNLSQVYQHSFGDFDYGIRATRMGIPILLAPGLLAICERNSIPKWRDYNISFKERWSNFHSPKGISHKELLYFLRLKGKSLPWLSIIKVYLTVIFPSLFSYKQNESSSK